MKILIDENLPHRLCGRLGDLLPEMRHVRDLGCNAASDAELWRFAVDQGYSAILTADIDFQNKVLELGPPPKVIPNRAL